jgi:hypothetical protein
VCVRALKYIKVYVGTLKFHYGLLGSLNFMVKLEIYIYFSYNVLELFEFEY